MPVSARAAFRGFVAGGGESRIGSESPGDESDARALHSRRSQLRDQKPPNASQDTGFGLLSPRAREQGAPLDASANTEIVAQGFPPKNLLEASTSFSGLTLMAPFTWLDQDSMW